MEHITVCICTYNRADLLARLLHELGRQTTDGLFTFSVVVIDNDARCSAEPVVLSATRESNLAIKYCVEPRQSIALARNRAVENCTGDYLAFIDDDEFPAQRWLATLYEACQSHRVDGVLGPVKAHFDAPPPAWVVAGQFYDRPSYPTGEKVGPNNGRTGNVLIRTGVFAGEAMPFRPEFRSGEDQDFFRRMMEKGFTFIWCDEALAYEVVPPSRWKRSVMLRRALLRGQCSILHPTLGRRGIAKSLVAVPAYTAALPFTLALGQSRFMNLLIRLFDHLGRLAAVVGIKVVKEAYVTE